MDANEQTVRLPPGTALDAGAIGKGLAADMVAEMLLDTGAQVNLLPRLDGLGAHFRKIDSRTKISDGGQSGATASPLGIVDEVTVGGIRFPGMLFAIFEVPYLGGNGILGSQAFQRGRVEIDYPGKMISFW